MTLVILAAGLGARYGGLKQIEPVGPGGATIMDYSIFDARQAGFERVVFVIRPEMQAAFDATIAGRYAGRLAVAYAPQRPDALPPGFALPAGRTKPWGTGHALLAAEPLISTSFAVANADDFYGSSAFAAAGEFLRSAPAERTTHAVVGYPLRNTLSDSGPVARAVCRCTPDGWLQSISEITGLVRSGDQVQYADAGGQTHVLTGDEPVSMNLWAFQPTIFAALRREFKRFLQAHGISPTAEFYLPQAIDAALQEGALRVRVLPARDRWAGVTHPHDRERVTQMIRQLIDRGVYPETLWT